MPLDLHHIFTYHAPKNDQVERYGKLRKAALDYATIISELTPSSPEQTLSIRNIQTASMWANAAIALTSFAEFPTV